MATRKKSKSKAPARKPAARKAAGIKVHTDEYGRKVYSIVGTKKYAYTLKKAQEIAAKAKSGGKKRTSAVEESTALTTTRKRKAVTRRRGGKADSRFKGFDGLELDEPMTAAERRAVLAKAKAGRRKKPTTKRRTTRRN